MGILSTTLMLLTAVVYVGAHYDSTVMETGPKARLTSLRANQKTFRQEWGSATHRHTRHVKEMTGQGGRYASTMMATRPKERLTSLRANQKTFRQEWGSATHRHTRHVKEMTGQEVPPGPCEEGGYRVINDSRRSASKYDRWVYHDICDIQIHGGWYRFYFEGGNAVVPTRCIPVHHCHTDGPVWLDLQNQTLPEDGRQINARACAHWAENCCRWEAPITVRNCGDFFVYKITAVTACETAFCVEPQD